MKIPVEWLIERVEMAPTSYHRGVGPADALRTRGAWQKLHRQAGEGDELWAFSSPPRGWAGRGRYTGYALVRDGVILQTELVEQG